MHVRSRISVWSTAASITASREKAAVRIPVLRNNSEEGKRGVSFLFERSLISKS